MPRVDVQLAGLRKADPGTAKGADTIRDALRSGSGFVVAAAAKLVEEHRMDVLARDLVDAFGTLVDKETDPGCRGRLALAKALYALERWEPRVFEIGLAVRQLEGMRPQEDTAATLRGVCALAHAHFLRPDALDVCAAMLADPERAAREGAARGIGDAGRPDGGAVLRYKLLASDNEEPDVLAACIDALLHLQRDTAIAFLTGMLRDHDARAEVVALALGGARTGRDALIAWTDRARAEQRQRVGYVALALLRDDAANAVLLAAIREAATADALAAAKALATFRDDTKLMAQVRAAAPKALQRELAALLD